MREYLSFIFGLLSLVNFFGQTPISDTLNVNNIGARFFSNGLFSEFELGPGSGQYTLYGGNIWMGGLPPSGPTKTAAALYNNSDFYNGPIAINGASGNQPGYDNVWKITQQEIDDFVAWYLCFIDPFCTPSPSYVVPSVITNWPAHGDVSQGQSYYLAPFVDVNQNGVYEPNFGEYPYIKGDMAIFTIFNDNGIHYGSGGTPIGVEIRALHYAFANDPDGLGRDSIFQNTIFSEYSLYNYSDTTLTDFYVGIWTDMDIGCYDNDYAGCDVSRGLGYTYNGTPSDDVTNAPCTGPFGANPPAQGVTFLKGLKADNDGADNPLTTDIPTSLSQDGIPYDGLGCNYGDGVVDNEYKGLSNFIYYDPTLPSNSYGSPTAYDAFYNNLNGIWRDGANMAYGGLGHPSSPGSSSVNANYAYPADSDPYYWSTSGVSAIPTNWSEVTNGNSPGDRRILSSMGPITFQAGNHYEFAVAHLTGRDTSGVSTGLDILFNNTDVVRDYYGCETNIFNSPYSYFTVGIDEIAKTPEIKLYPNPTKAIIYFSALRPIQQATVYTITGKLVYRSTGSNITSIDLSEFKDGVYLVELIIDDSRVIQKVIKE